MKGRAITYVALGDSAGVGVGAGHGRGYVDRLAARMREKGARVDVVNLCISGGTTEEILRGPLARALSAKPTVVTLGIGANDMIHGRSAEEYAANLDRIAQGLATLKVPVIVANLPDLSQAPAARGFPKELVRAQLAAYNQRVAEVVARRGLIAFDLFTGSGRLIPEHPEFFSPDGFHPSAMGYEAWAGMMWPAVESALAPSEPHLAARGTARTP